MTAPDAPVDIGREWRARVRANHVFPPNSMQLLRRDILLALLDRIDELELRLERARAAGGAWADSSERWEMEAHHLKGDYDELDEVAGELEVKVAALEAEVVRLHEGNVALTRERDEARGHLARAMFDVAALTAVAKAADRTIRAFETQFAVHGFPDALAHHEALLRVEAGKAAYDAAIAAARACGALPGEGGA